MKYSRNLLQSRKIAYVFCAFLFCIALLFGAVLPTVYARTSINELPQTNRESVQANPLREYTSLSVSVPEGLSIYTKITTAGDLKRNIVVMGTYSSEQGDETVALKPTEYTVRLNGRTYADSQKFFETDEDSGETATVQLTCGKQVVTIDEIPVILSVPEYLKLKVVLKSGINQIEDDHTADTLKNVLDVYGVDAADKETLIVNKELYFVETVGLTLGKNTVTVKYLPDESCMGTLVVTAVAATIQSISVEPDPKLELRNGYYYKENGNSAFVAGMTGAEIITSLQVNVHYQNSKRAIELDANGEVSSEDTEISSCRVTNSNFSVGSQQVNVTVRTSSNYSFAGTVSVQFESLSVKSIAPTYINTSKILTTATELVEDDFEVIPTYNNGTEGSKLDSDKYTVESSLIPTADEYSRITDGKYSKTVWVTCPNGVKNSVTLNNVEYIAPTEIIQFEGRAVSQPVLKEFDCSGINVILSIDGNEVYASLESLRSYCTFTYYEGSAVSEFDYITRNTTKVKVECSYPGIEPKSRDFSFGSTIQADYAIPDLDVSDLDFSEGVSKIIKDIGRFVSDKSNVKVSVTDIDSGEIGAIYKNDGTVEVFDTTSASQKVGATFDSDTGEITFTRGGIFTVTFELLDGTEGSYRWAQPSASNPDRVTPHLLKYTLTVNKASLDVRLTRNGAEIKNLEAVYGSLDEVLAQIGIDCITVGSNVSVVDKPDFELRYYGNGISYANATTEKPKNVGTYYVVAVTKPTDAYEQSKTFSGFAVNLTIKPRPVSVGNVINNQTYDRRAFELTDFIKLSSDDVLGEDLVGGKLPIEIAPYGTKTEYFHVDTYQAKLTIANPNYVWENPTDASKPLEVIAEFQITEPIQSFAVDFVDAFEYSDTLASAPQTHKTSEKFFASIGEAKIYRVETDGSKTEVFFADYQTWTVGDYIVEFMASVNKEAGDNENDYQPFTVGKQFKVITKKIDRVTIETAPAVYDGASHEFVLENYRSDIMSYTVKGLTFGNTAFVQGIVYDNSNAHVSVKYAGTYTATVSITDSNYEWKTVSSDGNVCKPEYTLGQEEIIIVYEQEEVYPAYKFPYNAAVQETPKFSVGNVRVEADGLNITYSTYADADFSAEKPVGGIGVYYIKFTFTAGSAADGFDLSANYVMPTNLPESFEILSAKLNIPTLKGDLSDGVSLKDGALFATYKGGIYSAEKYFNENISVFEITVTKDASNADIINVGTYTLHIVPAENYSWEDGLIFNGVPLGENGEVVYTFTVEQLEVEISWDSKTLTSVFDADNRNQKPAAGIDNKKGDDKVSLVIEVGLSAEDATADGVYEAGVYTVYIKELNGEDKDNYKISFTYTRTFVIQKQTVARPIPTKSEMEYADGTTAGFANGADYWQFLSGLNVTEKVAGTNPWYTVDGANPSVTGGAFVVSSGKFTYENAGKYTVTLTLGDAKNYCWAPVGNEAYDIYSAYFETEFMLTVTPKSLVAPTIGDDRAMRWDNDNLLTPTLDLSSLSGMDLTVLYGKYDGGYLGVESATSVAASRGEYYVRFKLNGDGIYNYRFTANSGDHASSLPSYLSKWEECVYVDGDVSVYIHFAVTNTILDIGFEFENFVFGDNYQSTEIVLENVIGATGNDSALLEGEFSAGRITFAEVLFEGKDGIVGSYVYEAGKPSVIGEALVGGLPWHADTYTVSIEIRFAAEGDNASNYEDIKSTATLIVFPRVIEAVWSNGDSLISEAAGGGYEVVYDGEEHTLVAEIADSVLYGNDKSKFLLTVALSENRNQPSAVKGDEEAYILKVVDILFDGTATGDYTVKKNDGETYACENRLTVKRRAVKLIPENSGHIYGNDVGIADWKYAVDSLEFAEKDKANAQAFIEVKFLDLSGMAVTSQSSVGNGYKVVLAKKDGHDAFFANYDLNISSIAAYTISRRSVVVNIDTMKAASKYGEAINLGDGVWSVDEGAIPQFDAEKSLFTLAAKDGDAEIDIETHVGSYPIEFKNTDSNYEFSFREVYSYTVTKNVLTVDVSLTVFCGENNPSDYDGNGVTYHATRDYLRTDTEMYTVKGFKNGEETAWEQGSLDGYGGTFDYAVDYDPANCTARDYEITLILDGANPLVSKNYEFVAGNCVLHVVPVSLVVKVKSTYAIYNTSDVLALDYDVELPLSKYGTGLPVAEPSDYADIFELKTEAFDAVVGSTTNNADFYSVVCNVKNGNYSVDLRAADGSKNPMFEIRRAKLNTATVNAYGGDYDEKAHFVLILDGEEEVEVTDGVTLPEYVTRFASANDGGAITVYFIMSSTQLSSVDWNKASESMPTVTDAGEYYVYYRIVSDNGNYEPEDRHALISVEQSENKFIDKAVFGNGSDIKASSEVLGEDFAVLAKFAWGYGLYDEKDNLYGYNSASADHCAEMPETVFKKGASAVTVKLYYYSDINEVGLEIGSGTDISALIGQAFADGRINAGYYRFEFAMKGTANYFDAVGSRVFKVDKKTLSVTPHDKETIYGSTDIPEFTFEYSGFVCGGKTENGGLIKDTLQDVALSIVPVFGAVYSVGDNAGDYTISCDNETDCVSRNYRLICNTATLTVTPREVTIAIADLENFFNLDDGTAVPQSKHELVYTVSSQLKFYEPDGDVINLFSDAYNPCDESEKTNNVGLYPIFAKWTNAEHKGNYIIKFVCSEKGKDLVLPSDTDIVVDSQEGVVSWGTFEIKSAQLVIGYDAPSETYDGNERIIVPQLSGKYEKLKFVTKYYSVVNDEDILLADGVYPIDVGSYKFEFIYDSQYQNYISARSQFGFEIKPADLTVEVNNTDIPYGTDFSQMFGVGNVEHVTYRIGSLSAAAVENAIKREKDKNTQGITYFDDSAIRYTCADYTATQNAGRNFTVEVDTDSIISKNYRVTFNKISGNLRVVKRDVTFTVLGYDNADKINAQGLYGQHHKDVLNEQFNGNMGRFLSPVTAGWNGSSRDGYEALRVELAVNATYLSDVGDTYVITATSSSLNYNVRFEYGAGAFYKVNQAPLTVRAVTDSTVIYGNAANYSYSFSGFKNDQDYRQLVDNAGAEYVTGQLVASSDYTRWSSQAGQVCTVTYEGSTLWFKNYEVTYASVKFTVVSRVVSLGELKSLTYTEDGDDYHGGEYGAKHVPTLNFSNAYVGSDNTYKPVFTLSYYNTRTGQTLSDARTADEYRVTVTLSANGVAGGTYYNYVFEGELTSITAARDFTVNKKSIGLAWSPSYINFDTATDKSSSVYDVIESIMNVDEVYRQYNLDSSTVATEPLEKGDGYEWNGVTLSLTAKNTGNFHAVITLNEKAVQNYILGDGVNVGINVRLILRVVSDNESVNLSVEIKGWVYNEPQNSPIGTIVGDGDTNLIHYTYALAEPNVEYKDLPEYLKVCFTDEMLLNELGIRNGNAAFGDKPFEAGIYVVRAYYPTGQSAYYVFEIKQAVMTAPSAPSIDYRYNGSRQELRYTFEDAMKVSAHYDGDKTYTSSAITFFATDAGRYVIEFSLSDTRNYKWTDGVVLNSDGKVEIVWIIDKAADEIIDFGDYSETYGDGGVPSANAVSREHVYLVYRPMTDAELSYTPDDYVKLDAYTDGWGDKPKDHGNYWIKAVSNGNGNYETAWAYARLTIDKKTLIATPNATIVYGIMFNPNATIKDGYGYTLSGFVGTDTESDSAPVGTVTYKLVGSYGVGDILDASDTRYKITLETENGEVLGLTSRNYRVIAAEGSFIVLKRTVNVRIGDTEVIYGDILDTDKVKLDIAEKDISPVALGITLKLDNADITAKLNVGSYTLMIASYSDGNYDISVTTGIYSVIARSIEIATMHSDGGTVGATDGAEVLSMYDASDPFNKKPLDAAAFGTIKNMLAYTYTGTTDGSMPTSAGTYYVTVSVDSANYALVGQTSYLFEISRRVIDASEISLESMQYTGDVIDVSSIRVNYGSYDSSVFTVSFDGTLKEVGFYTLTLVLTDFDNTKWLSVDTVQRSISFEITQADNVLESLSVKGWVYGGYDRVENAPHAVTKFGNPSDYVYTYYADNNGQPQWSEPLLGVPVNAGKYWVTVYVPESKNFKSLSADKPTQFTVEKAVQNTPSLGIITEGDGKNDTYTGANLQAEIVGFDTSLMEVYYDGISNISGNRVSVYAVNAGTYTVKLVLKNADNYRWSDNAEIDSDGNALLKWTVARKKLSSPSADTGIYVVNGNVLTYVPVGFDSETMNISGNTASYGGDYQVIVTLKDADNYEWEDGTASSYVFVWHVVGADTVFVAVVASLCVLTVVTGGIALIQFLGHKRRLSDLSAASKTKEGGDE